MKYYVIVLILGCLGYLLPLGAMESNALQLPQTNLIEAFLAENFSEFEQLEETLPVEVWAEIMEYALTVGSLGPFRCALDAQDQVIPSKDYVYKIACNEDGSKLITAGGERPIYGTLWKCKEKKFRRLITDQYGECAIRLPLFLSENEVFMIHKDEVTIFDLEGTVIRQLKIGSSIINAAISPRGTYLMTIDSESKLVIWDLAEGEPLFEGHHEHFTDLCAEFSPQEDRLLLSQRTGLIDLYEKRENGWCFVQQASTKYTDIKNLTFNDDGSSFLTTTMNPESKNYSVSLWNTGDFFMVGDNPLLIRQNYDDNFFVRAYFIDNDSKILIINESSVQIIDALNDGCWLYMHTFKNHTFCEAELAPDGKHLIIASLEGPIFLYDSINRALCGVLRGHAKIGDRNVWRKNYYFQGCFDKTGSTLVTRQRDKKVLIWNLKKVLECFKNLSMRQQLLILCVAETVRARATVKAFDEKRVFNKGAFMVGPGKVMLDISKSPKLKEIYKSLPVYIQKSLEPFLKIRDL